MKADNLYGRFLTLEGGPASPDAINVLPFTDGSPHRFGVSSCGEPVFFVCCADHMSAASVHLRLINVTLMWSVASIRMVSLHWGGSVLCVF